MKKEIIFQVVALAILVGGGYVIYNRIKTNTTSYDSIANVDTIIDAGKHGNRNFIETFNPEFLAAWANAIRQNKLTFVYNGKTINTQGGSTAKK
jgi:hypothetical protein